MGASYSMILLFEVWMAEMVGTTFVSISVSRSSFERGRLFLLRSK